jgi:hypothetical protein
MVNGEDRCSDAATVDEVGKATEALEFLGDIRVSERLQDLERRPAVACQEDGTT